MVTHMNCSAAAHMAQTTHLTRVKQQTACSWPAQGDYDLHSHTAGMRSGPTNNVDKFIGLT